MIAKYFRKYRKEIICCFGIVVVVLAFLNRGVMMKGLFFGADESESDLLEHTFVYRQFWATDFLKKGIFLTWNQYLGSGMPVLGEAQTGIFHPVSLLMYLLLPARYAFNWLIISSFLIAGLGMFFYARKIKLPPSAAFLASVIFTLSGFMVGHLRHVPIITVVEFMPFLFLATEFILEGSVLWTFILPVLIAFSFFAGNLTTVYTMLLFVGLYFLLRLSAKVKSLILFVSAFIGGILLAAVEIILALEMEQFSTRTFSTFSSKFYVVYKLKYLLMFISPYILGNPSRGTWDMSSGSFWENIGYFGIVPLILAIVGVVIAIKKKNKLMINISCLIFIAFLLMLGENTPFYNLWIKLIPGFALTHTPGRFSLFVDFFGAVLAGFGLAELVKKFSLKKTILVVSVIILSTADLFYFGYNFNTVMPFSYFSEPESVKFLKQDTGFYRIKSVGFEDMWQRAYSQAAGWTGDLSPYIWTREMLLPDYNLFFRIPSNAVSYELSGHLTVKKAGELDEIASQSVTRDVPNAGKILGMSNVKYVLTDEKVLGLTDLKLVKSVNEDEAGFTTYIYQNDSFLPRAYFVNKAKYFQSSDDLSQYFFDPQFDPAHEVLIEGTPDHPDTGGTGNVNIVSYAANKVELNAISDKGGFVVLSDTYYPGWRAVVDGQETKIYMADYNFRTVYVGPGQHNIIFTFDPLSVKAGIYLSLGAFLLFAILAAGSIMRRHNEKK